VAVGQGAVAQVALGGAARPLRIALFTLDSAISAEAVGMFAWDHAAQLVLIGRSDPARLGLAAGWRHLRRSGPRFLPFLLANYALPAWRGVLRRGPGPLAALAASRGIPCAVIRDVNDAASAALLRQAAPDLILSCHFDQIFAAETLALARLGGINLHPSLLPRHRGPVPTFWALAEAPPQATGVTLHRLVPQIDAGAVLAQQAVTLPPGTTVSGAARALHLAGVALLPGVLAALAAGPVAGRVDPKLPYCPFPPPAALRQAARRGVRLVDAADWRAALRCHIG
jgi:folate-dependent phosphoribosylglycinamide formyltransferase PurN